MIYWQIFVVFLKIGLSGFGGGYAMLSLFRQEVVQQRGWLNGEEFADIVAMAQVMPGPISINCAAYAGYAAAHSAVGAALAVMAVILPSFLLMMGVVLFFGRIKDNAYVQAILAGLRPAVVAFVAAAAVGFMNSHNFQNYKSVIVFLLAFAALWKWHAQPLIVVALAGIAGILFFRK